MMKMQFGSLQTKYECMIKISRSKIVHNGKQGEDVVTSYALLSDLETEDHEILRKKKEIRALLRCKGNLEMVSIDLAYFLARYYKDNDDPINSFSIEPRAILSHCLMHYRACFVKGENDLKPISFLDDAFELEQIHTMMRFLGDKLVGHLDKDSEARKDEIKWGFEFSGNKIVPVKPELFFNKILSLHRTEVIRWQEHIGIIVEQIDGRLKELTISINSKIEVLDDVTIPVSNKNDLN